MGRAPWGSLVLGRDGCRRSQTAYAPAPTVTGHRAEPRPAVPHGHPVRGEVQEEVSVHEGFSVSQVSAGPGQSNPHGSLSDPTAFSVCPAACRCPHTLPRGSPGPRLWAGLGAAQSGRDHRTARPCRTAAVSALEPHAGPITPVPSPPPQPAGTGAPRPSDLSGAAQASRPASRPVLSATRGLARPRTGCCRRRHCDPYFTVGKTEAQRGEVTPPRSHS